MCTNDEVVTATGTVVVIDVLRAFTTAAVVLAQQPASYELVRGLEEARRRRQADPAVRLLGEVDGRRPSDFDHSNSPCEAAVADLGGRHVVHRSSAGTQGAVLAEAADRVFVASFAVASATLAAVAADDPRQVTFCITGRHDDRDGDEDAACAEYLAARLTGWADPAAYVARVPGSSAGQMFTDRQHHPHLSPEDLAFAQVVDRFDFAMRTTRRDGRVLLHRVEGSSLPYAG